MRFTVDARRLLTVLLSLVLVAGSGCSRARRGERTDWEHCCEGLEACLALLQNVSGPDPGQVMPLRWLPEEQRCAAENLGREKERAVPSLVPLLDHPDSRVRGGAAYALGQLSPIPPAVVSALLPAAEREPGGYAMAALGRADDVRALPLLRRHLEQIPYPVLADLRLNVLPVLLEVLEDASSSQERLMRVSAAMADKRATEPEWLPRLRALLRRELDEPTLRRPPDASCPVPPVQGCQVVFDGCTPRAAHIAWALSNVLINRRKSVQAEDLVELREAVQRGDPRLTPIALAALVTAYDTAAVGPLLKELEVPACRSDALLALGSLGWVDSKAREEMAPPLLALLDSDAEPWVRASALHGLRDLDDESAWGPLRRALESNHSEIQEAALRALGEGLEKRHEGELVPILERIARTTRSPSLWDLAPRMLAAHRPPPKEEPRGAGVAVVEGRSPEEPGGWMPCTPAKTRGEDLEVTVGSETVRIRPAEDGLPTVGQGACEGHPDSLHADLLEPVGSACFVGHGRGEFGGSLWISEKGRMLRVPGIANPKAIVSPHGSLVVVDNLWHLGTNGSLMWIEPSGPEGWSPTQWLQLPSVALGYGYTRSGDLVVVTMGRSLDDSKHCEASGGFWGYVLRVTPDGQLVNVE